MVIVCEICKNKEVEYLPYPIKNEIYLKLICFFCKEEINICSLCTKYIYKKDKDDDYFIIPDEYKNISDSLHDSNPQCRKCMNKNKKNEYKYCDMCFEYVNIKEFIFCYNCNCDSCKKCNKNNCCVCEQLINKINKLQL